MVKNTLPLLEIAAIMLIWGRRRAFETKIRFFARAHPLFLWSVLLTILSSILKISVPAFNALMYSKAATCLLRRVECSSNRWPTTPKTRYLIPSTSQRYCLRMVAPSFIPCLFLEHCWISGARIGPWHSSINYSIMILALWWILLNLAGRCDPLKIAQRFFFYFWSTFLTQ